MLPDGCLEHLGRKDFRVKIRGFGVQLEEVEKTLRGHPTVREAIVEARMGESKDARLIAYIVPDQTQSLTTTELRRLLQSKLPDYMIPSAFVFLEALPLSPNGKVDRRSLPPPGRSRPELDTAFVAPRTPVEEELARIWVEVLSIDQVGVYDNFLELGGHSLAATQVISRVIKKFEFELPVQFLFQAPTVAQMAAAIGESRAKKLDAQDLDRILTDVESLSENEARQFLAQGNPKRN
jgi:acyl-coenzyme A synthetase/AMP-(fatty) acid ligase